MVTLEQLLEPAWLVGDAHSNETLATAVWLRPENLLAPSPILDGLA